MTFTFYLYYVHSKIITKPEPNKHEESLNVQKSILLIEVSHLVFKATALKNFLNLINSSWLIKCLTNFIVVVTRKIINHHRLELQTRATNIHRMDCDSFHSLIDKTTWLNRVLPIIAH